MSWSENNQRFLKEIEASHQFKSIGEAQGGTSSQFIFTGYFDSRISRRLWTGLKIPLWGGGALIEHRAVQELTFFETIAKEKPRLIPTLPRFYGYVTTNDNEPAAIIMEDHSKGGRIPLTPVDISSLPSELAEYGFRFGLRSSLGQIAVKTPNQQLRVIDVYSGFLPEDQDNETRQKIEDELSKYTIKASFRTEE